MENSAIPAARAKKASESVYRGVGSVKQTMQAMQEHQTPEQQTNVTLVSKSALLPPEESNRLVQNAQTARNATAISVSGWAAILDALDPAPHHSNVPKALNAVKDELVGLSNVL